MKIELELHKSSEELPKVSGMYFVLNSGIYPYSSCVNYSAEKKLFNAADYDEDVSNAFDVDYWAEIPKEFLTVVK